MGPPNGFTRLSGEGSSRTVTIPDGASQLRGAADRAGGRRDGPRPGARRDRRADRRRDGRRHLRGGHLPAVPRDRDRHRRPRRVPAAAWAVQHGGGRQARAAADPAPRRGRARGRRRPHRTTARSPSSCPSPASWPGASRAPATSPRTSWPGSSSTPRASRSTGPRSTPGPGIPATRRRPTPRGSSASAGSTRAARSRCSSASPDTPRSSS